MLIQIYNYTNSYRIVDMQRRFSFIMDTNQLRSVRYWFAILSLSMLFIWHYHMVSTQAGVTAFVEISGMWRHASLRLDKQLPVFEA